MRFKTWLMQEVGTYTNCIAGFKRITLPMVYRTWPTDDLNKKRRYRVPQVEESYDNPKRVSGS
jgi:hypothetical protein